MKLLLTLILLAFTPAFASNDISLSIENNMRSAALSMSTVKTEADDIVKTYFATGASSQIAGLATDGTAATVGSKLTKAKFINGITMAQQLQNFFANASVVTDDYMATSANLINGSDAAGAALSQDVEVLGARLVTMGNTMIQLKKSCESMLSAYNSSELAAAIVSISLPTVVYGCSTSKQKFVDGMNLCQQVVNFMGNSAVTTGDWNSTVNKWAQGF